MKKVAVIADAMSPEFFFPAWHRYYAGLFGAENLHVVTYKGMKPAFAGIELGNLWGVDAGYDDVLRTHVISDLIAALLRQYDVVIRCDIDEFLYPDPAKYADLSDYIERNELPYVTAQGIDAVEMAEDAPLDLDQPIFGVQRHYGIRATSLNKTCVTTIPLRWAAGFHGASVPPCFAGLYLLHLKFADLKKRIAWDETMLQGVVPGSKEHKYFSVGLKHLTGVRDSWIARPKTGVETEWAFNERFLASVGHDPVHDIHQGRFFMQDFLLPLDGFAPKVARKWSDVLLAYQGASLAAPPAGESTVLEEPIILPFPAPALVADLSDQDWQFAVPADLQVHGSYLVQHKNALLFGPNALVGEGGRWSCAARGNSGVFLDFYRSPGYAAAYPGPKPEILRGPEALTLDVSMLRPDDVLVIDEPLFLATPLRPAEWNFWVTSMPGQIAQFHRHGAGRKFLCHTAFEWQRAFLRLAGVPDAAMLMHDPGRSYICRDVMAVEYSEVNMTISAGERTGFFELVAAKQARGTYPRKLLVAPTPHNPVLQTPLETSGFAIIEPKTLDFAVQIGMLAAAEQIVFHGPLAVGGSVFCQPGASVITIDTTADEAGVHAGLLASLGLRHGALFGARGADDIARAVPVIEAFFRA